MAVITAAMVGQLRAKTDAPMMECKKALTEANGDIQKAEDILRVKLGNKASNASSRIAAEGVIAIHVDGTAASIVEVNCETDFVAKTDTFKQLCHGIAMHIAAANPAYLSREEVPAETVEKEREIARMQALNEGKKEQFVDKIVDGRINKFYKENCLLEQVSMIDGERTITELVNEAVSKTGEKISVRRFTRYEMGEGIEKRQDNFAEEVMSQMK